MTRPAVHQYNTKVKVRQRAMGDVPTSAHTQLIQLQLLCVYMRNLIRSGSYKTTTAFTRAVLKTIIHFEIW